MRTLVIDLAKNLFRIHGVDAEGRTALERQLRRPQLVHFAAHLQPCLVGMEAVTACAFGLRAIVKRKS
jgi:transposase